jgi:hypothetical protein
MIRFNFQIGEAQDSTISFGCEIVPAVNHREKRKLVKLESPLCFLSICKSNGVKMSTIRAASTVECGERMTTLTAISHTQNLEMRLRETLPISPGHLK